MTELQDALQDVDFPADKEALLEAAVTRSADMDRALRSLPPGVAFGNLQEVARSVDAAVEHGEGTVQRQSDTT